MKLWNLLKNDFQRAVFSFTFLLTSVGIAILISSSGYAMISQCDSVIHYMQFGMRGNGLETVISTILPLLPFALSFSFEWNEKAVPFYLIRSGPQQYILSKLIISAVSGFLVLVLGIFLSIPIIKIIAPQLPFVAENIQLTDFFDIFLINEYPALGYGVYMVDYALSGCLTAVCAVWFSTYIPNPFAALAAPMAIYYTLIRINFLTNINGWLRNSSFGFLSPVYWINVTHPTTSPAYQLGIKFSTVLVLCLLMGVATICQIKRRVKHGQLS